MRTLLTILLSTICFCISNAGVRLSSGDFSSLYGMRNIPVYLDWDKAKYSKAGTLDDFLIKATRSEEWEKESLDFFIKEVNNRIGEYGTNITFGSADTHLPYIIIRVFSISVDGDIKGEIILAHYNDVLATALFSSDTSDDDDEIAFKDQMENIGENFGKLLNKVFEKHYKKINKIR